MPTAKTNGQSLLGNLCRGLVNVSVSYLTFMYLVAAKIPTHDKFSSAGWILVRLAVLTVKSSVLYYWDTYAGELF